MTAIESQDRPQEDRPLRLAVVDDYDLVVAGLAAMLTDQTLPVRIVAARSDDLGAVPADLFLFDPLLGGESGLADLVDRVGDRVVVFSWATDQAKVERALAVGAAGYLFKGAPTPDLVSAVLTILAGDIVKPRPLIGARGTGVRLSAREAEVLELIAAGLTNAEIADRTFLSINSVKTYIRGAYRKIGATRRTQAVSWCHEQQQT